MMNLTFILELFGIKIKYFKRIINLKIYKNKPLYIRNN